MSMDDDAEWDEQPTPPELIVTAEDLSRVAFRHSQVARRLRSSAGSRAMSAGHYCLRCSGPVVIPTRKCHFSLISLATPRLG
jgi:hypothetical protein